MFERSNHTVGSVRKRKLKLPASENRTPVKAVAWERSAQSRRRSAAARATPVLPSVMSCLPHHAQRVVVSGSSGGQAIMECHALRIRRDEISFVGGQVWAV